MKAVCIIGSPRESGNTALVVDKVITGLAEAGIEISRHVLGLTNINFCKGCKSCYENKPGIKPLTSLSIEGVLNKADFAKRPGSWRRHIKSA